MFFLNKRKLGKLNQYDSQKEFLSFKNLTKKTIYFKIDFRHNPQLLLKNI